MRISLIDHHGQELDSASVMDGKDAPAEAMLMLARFGCLYSGSLLASAALVSRLASWWYL
jgi:hypothetical protein